MRHLYSSFLFLILIAIQGPSASAQGLVVTVQPPLGYDTTVVGTPDTFTVEVENTTNVALSVQYALVGADATLERTQDAIPSGSSTTVQFFFDPNQNLDYTPIFVAIPDRGLGPVATRMVAPAVFPLTDYRSTRNLMEEPLKQALKTIVSQGNPIGYSLARDAMYMTIDNQKVNGQGASQNTLECVYTGQLAVGYTNRADAQNNYGFNTEHTFPQGTFSGNEPMRSDLFHIFPTTATSNSERGNKPFGIVSNPTWQVGGSKSDANHFEPRAQQKGPTSRAMLYFLIRYQNYQNYVSATDQDLLKQWCLTYIPTAIEHTRNEDIEQTQGNRNPFIDYPQLAERITSFIGTSASPADVQMAAFPDTMHITGTQHTNTFTRQMVVANSGNRTYAMDWDFGSLNVGNVTWTTSYINDSLPPGHYGVLGFELNTSGQTHVSDDLTLTNSMQPGNPQSVHISAETGEEVVLGSDQKFLRKRLRVFPNPSGSRVCLNYGAIQVESVSFLDAAGRLVLEYMGQDRYCYDVSSLSAGHFIIAVRDDTGLVRSVQWVKQ